MIELILIGLILLCTLAPSGLIILHFVNKKDNKKQREFEEYFQSEQYERDRKVFQATIEGNLTIDKLEEIYYHKKQKNGDVK